MYQQVKPNPVNLILTYLCPELGQGRATPPGRGPYVPPGPSLENQVQLTKGVLGEPEENYTAEGRKGQPSKKDPPLLDLMVGQKGVRRYQGCTGEITKKQIR